MAIPKKIMLFRRKRAQDLRRFALKLEEFVSNEISHKLYKVAKQLEDPSYIPTYKNNKGEIVKGDVNMWGYSIDNIKIDINASKHLKPKGLHKAEASLSIRLVSDFRNWKDIKDPFCDLSFNVTIKGLKPKSDKEFHYSGFHLDRQPESEVSDEIHPAYHMHYNINPDKIKNFDYGSTLNLDVPRFLHYPMDLILGLSYLIGNFQPDNYSKLVDDTEVIRLIKDYQDSIWKPYSYTMSNHWKKNDSAIEWDKTVICPYLI